MPKKHYFTNHVLDRFKERFQHHIRDAGNVGNSLASLFYKSELNRSFINNTAFMLHVGEKHGYENFDVYTNDDMVFICREKRILTVYPIKNTIFDSAPKEKTRKKPAHMPWRRHALRKRK
jgi:hypothetical protein